MIVFTVIGYAVCGYLAFNLGWHLGLAWDVSMRLTLTSSAIEEDIRAIVAFSEMQKRSSFTAGVKAAARSDGLSNDSDAAALHLPHTTKVKP